MDDIKRWLEDLNLDRYIEAFEANAIDVELLSDLDEADLEKIGVAALGHRKRLLRAIADLGSAPAAKPMSAELSPPGQAERRQLTVLFCDLVGSTELSRKLDPEDLRDVMREYQDAVAGAVTRYGGHVAKYLGDGVLAYFGWPQAYEDQPARAVRAGLDAVVAVSAVQMADDAALAARLGIATGQVVVGDLVGKSGRDAEAVSGETPNLAARLQGVAEPGQVVIGEATHRLIGQTFTMVDLGTHELKGFDAPVQAWHIVNEVLAKSRFEAAHSAALTRLVGRETELQLLLDRWHLAEGGEGQAVLISGEAGIGKSRLMQGLRVRVAEQDHIRIRYQCSPYHTNSALYPTIQQLERSAGFAPGDDDEAKLDKLEAILRQAGDDTKADAPLFANLLSLPYEARYGALDESSQQIKARMLEALVARLLRLAEGNPLLFLFEDTHWIDPTSQELLELAIERLQQTRVLLIITHRLEWRSPFTGHNHVTSLQLNRLSKAQGAEIVREIAGNSVSNEVVERIVSRTDGVPLFTEELTKSLVEGGFDVTEADIPVTLQASLLARLDRLGPEAKEIAQIGAVIGREFSHEVIAAVAPVPETILRDGLDQLVSAELVFRRDGPINVTFTFKHALVQAAAYESLLLSNRRHFHQTIARALETKFPDQASANPELLAHHLSEGGLSEQAVQYWQEAGNRAARVSANTEAVGHLTRGMAVLNALERSPERDARALDLTFALLSPLAAAKGYSSSEMEEAVARALSLCERTGESVRMFPVLYGRWSVHHVRGHPKTCLALAQEFMALATDQPDPVPRALGHRMLGTSCVIAGEIVAAHQHLENALAVFNCDTGGAIELGYAQELGVSILCYDALALAMLGYPDQARRRGDDAIARARSVDHPNTLAFALWHCGQWLAWLLRDAEWLDTANQELKSVAQEHSLPLWLGWTKVFSGALSGWRGKPEKALAELADGHRDMEQIQAWVSLGHWHLIRAENLINSGRYHDAQEALDLGMSDVESSGMRWWEPEIHRLYYRLSISRPEGSSDEAEAHLRRAIERAQSGQTKLWELRAMTDLTRLWRARGDRCRAAAQLAPLYDWFTEGFNTPDLQDAKALLDKLG